MKQLRRKRHKMRTRPRVSYYYADDKELIQKDSSYDNGMNPVPVDEDTSEVTSSINDIIYDKQELVSVDEDIYLAGPKCPKEMQQVICSYPGRTKRVWRTRRKCPSPCVQIDNTGKCTHWKEPCSVHELRKRPGEQPNWTLWRRW